MDCNVTVKYGDIKVNSAVQIESLKCFESFKYQICPI